MKKAMLEKIQATVEEWARIHNVELILNRAKYSGIGSNIHVFVAARSGFENWEDHDRHSSLFQFIYKNANTNGDLFLSRLWTMTEEEYDRLEGLEV